MTRPLIGWDVETHLIRSDCIAPPLVCLSMAGHRDTAEWALTFSQMHRNDVELQEDPGSGDWAFLVVGREVSTFAFVSALQAGFDLVAHNQSFDATVMANYVEKAYILDAMESGRLKCTKVREKLIAIAEDNFKFDSRAGLTAKGKMKATSFSLAYLVQLYFGADISEDKKDPRAWRLRYKELDGVPLSQWPAKAKDYAVSDAIWALKLYEAQCKPLQFPEGVVVKEDGVVTDEHSQTAAALALQWVGNTGIRTDPVMVEATKREAQRGVQEAEAAAFQAGFVRINKCKTCDNVGYVDGRPCPDCKAQPCPQTGAGKCTVCGRKAWKGCAKDYGKVNQKALRAKVEAAYDHLGESPPLTETGLIGIGEKVLRNSGDPVLGQYGEGAFHRRMISRYVPDLLRGVDAPICDGPNELVRTGRTSWKHQQPPKSGTYRACFIPQEGNVLASIDYSSIEMGALAQVCFQFFGSSKLGDAINDGIDPHLLFAIELLRLAGRRLTYEEALALKKDGDKEVKDARQRSKAANFGFPGGMGAPRFMDYARGYGLSLGLEEARNLRRQWLRQWPVVSSYLRYIGTLTDRGDARIRQLASGRVRGGLRYSSCANTYFQGLAADGGKAALWLLTREMHDKRAESSLYGVRAWGYVHDEVLFEGPEETAHLWAPRASQLMEQGMGTYLPDVRVEAEPALMRRWNKDAEPRYDETGRLVVWAPK